MGGRPMLSSDSQKHIKSFTTVLASTLLEWLLIFMLLVYGLFGYLITKFARYCKLPIPCLLCSRIDHNLGSEKVGYYYDMICGKHKLEISSLVYCHFHEKLVDVCGMCESCLFSFATKDKSNAETYRLLVGKLGGEDLSGIDDDSVMNNHETKGLNMKHCSCCNELFTPRRHAQTLLQTKSIDFDDTDLDLPWSREFSQDRNNLTKEANSFHSSAELDLPLSREFGQDRNCLKKESNSFLSSADLDVPLNREMSQDHDYLKKETDSFHPPVDFGRENADSSVQFGYSELKVTSDTESDIQMSDAEDTRSLFSADPLRDLIVDSTSNKPYTAVSEDEYACDKPIDQDDLSPKPSQTSPLVQDDIIDFDDGLSVAPASAIGHGLEELNWQEIDLNLDSSPSTDLMNFDNVSESPNDVNVSVPSSIDISNVEADMTPEKVDVQDSKNLDIKDTGIVMEKVDVKDSIDTDVKEARVAQTLVNKTEKSQELENLQTITDFNNKNSKSGNTDRGLQIPNYMDLGDAYNLIINGKSRQLSSKLAEQLGGKESPRPTVNSDLKLFLSQLSQGSEVLSKDIISPRVSRNPDELKASDSSTSIGMKLLQKRLSLERNDSKSSLDRNESGIDSLDFSAVSEIEGESEVDRMRRQLEHDRKFLISLLKELEEERNASATSTNETMAMITRLQEEKAALQMEASHDLRMMEEQAEYDMEALDKLNDLLMEKEKEIQDLEAELEYYRTKNPNESNSDNVGASGSENISSPDNLNGVADNTKSNSRDPLTEIENERKHISECLNNLEKKLGAICSSRVHPDLKCGDQSGEQGEDMYDSKLPEDRQVKSETGEDGLLSDKVGFISTGMQQALLRRVHSFRRSKSAGAEQRALILKEAEIVALVNEVSSLSKRLQALETDQSFIEHSIRTLKSGEEGLIQEITSHLRELRKIGIRRHNECNPVKR